MANTRKLKLHGQTRKCSKSGNGLKQVPWLNVSGVWLKQAGFEVGNEIEVTISENELVIKTIG